jgi:hypothetical protein
MSMLRFTPNGNNVWDVKRVTENHSSTTIAVVTMGEHSPAMSPHGGVGLSLIDIQAIGYFMENLTRTPREGATSCGRLAGGRVETEVDQATR